MGFNNQHGGGNEFLHSQRGGIFETIFSLFNQRNACLDQAEFLSRRLEQQEETLRVKSQRKHGNMSLPRGNQMSQIAAFERNW